MKIYSEDELQQTYESFIAAITKTFKGDRLERLLHMYSLDELGKNLKTSPASGNANFSNPYIGGYIDHVLSVAKTSHMTAKLYGSIGGSITFSMEELMFAAFHHDLGKLGNKDEPYYVEQQSEWHRNNKGEYFVVNPNVQYMDTADRAFMTLNAYGIAYNETEFLGIKLANGLYVEDNVKYFKSFNPNRNHKIAIAHIIHMAKELTTLAFRQSNILDSAKTA